MKHYRMCGCWKSKLDGLNKFKLAPDAYKYGTLTTRPDLRENMGYYAPIFILEYEDV